jgi:hypothetical protein
MDGEGTSNNASNQDSALDTAELATAQGENELRNSAEKFAQREKEQQQQRENRNAQEKAQKARTEVIARSSSARADVLADPAKTTDRAPAKAPDKTPDRPVSPESAAAKTETTPAQPASTPPATPPPAAETPAATTPPPSAEKSWTTKLKDTFGKVWDSVKAIFAGISGKLTEWFNKIFKKKDAAAAAPASNNNNTPAPAPGTTPAFNEKPPGIDATWGLKGPALYAQPDFKAKTEAIAGKIGGGVTAQDLFAIFTVESGGDPQVPPNAVGTAGLLQWIPSTARSMYGLETSAIRQMSGLKQLDLVEKYFQPHFGKLHSFSDLYRTVFYPASIGKSPNYIFGSERKDPDYRIKVAEQNSGIAAYGTVPALRNGEQVMIKRGGKEVPLCLIDNAAFERFCNKKRPASSSLPVANS